MPYTITTIFTIVFLCFLQIHAEGFYDICPSLVGSTVNNTKKPWDDHMMFNKVKERINHINTYCGFPSAYAKGRQSASRVACYTTIDEEYGLETVDVDHYFPQLSYNKRVPVHDQIAARLRDSSQKSNTTARVGYIILAHKDYDQIVRLLKSTYHPNNVYLVHIDARSTELKKQLMEHAATFDNVAVMSSSFEIQWGSVDMVLATMEALFTLQDAADIDFFVNLSGQDYPICTPVEFASFLSTHRTNNFDFAFWAGEEYAAYRMANIFLWSETGKTCLLNDVKVKIPPVSIYGTSQWFTYNREFVQYLRTSPAAHRLLANLETSLIPDESYFGTLLMNSPFASQRIRNTLHYVTFTKGDMHPTTMKAEDFDFLTSPACNACFARKFDPSADTRIMDMLDEWRDQKKQANYIENHFSW